MADHFDEAEIGHNLRSKKQDPFYTGGCHISRSDVLGKRSAELETQGKDGHFTPKVSTYVSLDPTFQNAWVSSSKPKLQRMVCGLGDVD